MERFAEFLQHRVYLIGVTKKTVDYFQAGWRLARLRQHLHLCDEYVLEMGRRAEAS